MWLINLKQIGIGCVGYTGDFDGFAMPITSNDHYFEPILTDLGYVKVEIKNLTYTYYEGIFRCPECDLYAPNGHVSDSWRM